MDQKTIRGDLTACLQHLVEKYEAEPEQMGSLTQILCQIVECRHTALATWIRGTIVPRKEENIRLSVYLELLGYTLTERQNMSPVIKQASYVFTFCDLSIAEVADLVGFSTSDSGLKRISLILRGLRTPGSQMASSFENLVDLYKDDLKIKIEEVEWPPGWSKKIPGKSKSDEKPLVQHVEIPAVTKVVETDACVRIDKHMIVQTLAHGILTLRPLAQMVRSDQFTAEERAKLRELTGGDGVFELTNLLSALCSEHSRNIR